MKFFGREEELKALREAREISRENARFTVVTGRRRIGKTELVKRAFADGVTPCLYLLVTRRPEKVQSALFQEEAMKVLGIRIPGRCEKFGEVFTEVMAHAVQKPLTLIIDEFQEFDRVDSGIFGDIQRIWDEYQATAKVNLVVCGSVNRLINRIFFNIAEPLYGRNTGRLDLKPFPVSLMKRIFAEYHPSYTKTDLLSLWTITGGVARYVDLLLSNRAFTQDAMLKTIFGRITSFIDEGKIVLVEEFGKDYGTYFSLLAAIAAGRTTNAELKNEIGAEVGGYLTKLEDDYSLISKKQPIFERTRNKNCHYQIDDCFFRFWFRFIYKYQYLIELERFEELRSVVTRDFNVFAGYALERFFIWKFTKETHCTKIGGWWDRKGENEIDLVIDDEIGNTLQFAEVKIDPKRIDIKKLETKTKSFFNKNPELRQRKCQLIGLSPEDM